MLIALCDACIICYSNSITDTTHEIEPLSTSFVFQKQDTLTVLGGSVANEDKKAINIVHYENTAYDGEQ